MILSISFKNMLKSKLFEKHYFKGRRILNFRETQSIVWFMIEGLAREIKVDKDSLEETTSWFWLPNSFIYTTPGFFSRTPSQCIIEVLQDCKMLCISYEDWIEFKRLFKEAEDISENIRERYGELRQLHAYELKSMSTIARYQKNRSILQTLFNSVKLKYVAEYMGMTPDTLGKLRKKY